MADNIYGTGYTPGTAGNDTIVLTGTGHADGGKGSDNINGSSGNDVIQGGAGKDFLYGGKGDDTFLWQASDIKGETAANKAMYDKVFDFEGAGVNGGDSMVFYGFGAGSTFAIAPGGDKGVTEPGGKVTYDYILTNAATGDAQHIYVTSLNGKALTADDFHFYGTPATA